MTSHSEPQTRKSCLVNYKFSTYHHHHVRSMAVFWGCRWVMMFRRMSGWKHGAVHVVIVRYLYHRESKRHVEKWDPEKETKTTISTSLIRIRFLRCYCKRKYSKPLIGLASEASLWSCTVTAEDTEQSEQDSLKEVCPSELYIILLLHHLQPSCQQGSLMWLR